MKACIDTQATRASVPEDSAFKRAWWNDRPLARARLRTVGTHSVRVHCHANFHESRANAFLVHGMADSSETWASILPSLVDHNVWLIDLPWSGRDGADWPSHLSSEAWWDLAVELADVKPDLLIGHSYGATVVLDWMMRRAGNPPSQLILMSPFYQDGKSAITWDHLDQYVRDMPERFKEALRVRFEGQPPEPEILDSMARKLEKRVLPDAILELFRIFLRSRGWPLASAAFRCDIVVGESESPMLRDAAVALATLLPDAACHQIRHCGHYVMHEQPVALNEVLSAVLAHKTLEHKSA